MKITAVRPKIPRRPAKPGLNAGRIQRLGPIGKPVSPRCIPARATARATCTSPSHNRTIATVKMTAPTVSRAIRTIRATPAVGLGAGKFVGIVRCPDPHLSQFPNESVPIRTVSLAGFGNGVPSGLFPFLRFELFDECSEMRGTHIAPTVRHARCAHVLSPVAPNKTMLVSAINLAEHDIERADDRRDVGEHVPAAQEIHRLQMGERRRPDLALIRAVGAVRH
jgi:hypothetical protein